MTESFTCACCGEAFGKARSDEEAAAEARDLFSPAELEAVEVVCDDCWRKIMADVPRIRAELAREATAAGVSFEEYVRREGGLAP